MEMVVMLDSKSSAERRVGSSPTEGTMKMLEAFSIMQEVVKEIRKMKTQRKFDEIGIGLNSKNVEVLIYFHTIIEKLTKVKIVFVIE